MRAVQRPPLPQRWKGKMALNEVTPGTTDAIAVLIPQRYKERAQPSNISATCIINGSDPTGGKNTTRRRYEFHLLVR